MTADWPASPFWDFSLRVYSQPEVERCCLTLQDEHGLDVNLVLLATWAAGTGRVLDPTLAARLRQIGDDYQAAVMRPLREARRALKSQRVTPALSPILAERRRLLLALELDLERLEQVQLEALTSPVADDAEAAGDALLAANLATLYPEHSIPPAMFAALAALLPADEPDRQRMSLPQQQVANNTSG
jgi:uncharacterized protein (TIGR02444 family)